MQVTLQYQKVLAGIMDVRTTAVEVAGAPQIVLTLIVHQATGTSPTVAVQLETSDDLEEWAEVGTPAQATTTGVKLHALQADMQPWGRYVRVLVKKGGAASTTVHSLYMNTFRST